MKNKSEVLLKIIQYLSTFFRYYVYLVFFWLFSVVFIQLNNQILGLNPDGVFVGLKAFSNYWLMLRNLGISIFFLIGLFEFFAYAYFIETKKRGKADQVKQEVKALLKSFIFLILSYYIVGLVSDLLNVAYYISIALANS